MPVVCSFFMRGSCRFGNRCWNSHDLGSMHPESPFERLLSLSETTNEEMAIPRLRVRPLASLQMPPQTASPAATSATRTRPQVPSDPAPKSQNNQAESNKSLYSLTNINYGETLEGSPDTLLVETVKRLNEAENMVNTLRQQLKSKNDGDNFSWIEHQMEQCIENDLQCNICYEIYIKPTVLNCSHTFCHECIESWTRRVNQCPTCRVYVKNKSYCLTLDTFLDKITECLPDEIKTRRESLKVERNNNRIAETNRNRRNNTRRRNSRNQSVRQTLGVLWGQRNQGVRDGAEWNIELEEGLFDPIYLGDVLGTNRNDRVEWDDDLSDSSIDSHIEYGFCSYCDNMGHSASNCPISIMDENMEDIW